ncbi:hypothetical protein IV500_03750 [Paeniglutamicibacter antarcticus]|uniref:Uncharacterized protein n=1 Tax=Arthrobacter terrae TaxID=2935737 RepID=A0A931G9B7_9MICC|nr:hypothetical protein [Arthrobacter terrae]MBG0738537.1 hypothetical protein [Arthrobacter terrae]
MAAALSLVVGRRRSGGATCRADTSGGEVVVDCFEDEQQLPSSGQPLRLRRHRNQPDAVVPQRLDERHGRHFIHVDEETDCLPRVAAIRYSAAWQETSELGAQSLHGNHELQVIQRGRMCVHVTVVK